MIGNYYCYDNPAALINQMSTLMGEDHFEQKYSLLYSVYSIPNMVLPFFGGYFVDKFGTCVCMLIFCSLITIGQILFSLGASLKMWSLMFLGRLIFGLGGENLNVAQSSLLAQWFQGKELALAFGINLSIARIGSVINNFVSPAVAKAFRSTPAALWVGCIICGASMLSAIIIYPIERDATGRIKRGGSPSEDLTAALLDSPVVDEVSSVGDDKIQGIKTRAVSMERLSSSVLSLDSNDADEDEEVRVELLL